METAKKTRTFDDNDDGQLDSGEILKAFPYVSVRADILHMRMRTENEMAHMLCKLPPFFFGLALFAFGLMEISPTAPTYDIHLHMFRHFAIGELTSKGEMEYADVYEYLSLFADGNAELQASAPKWWCEDKYLERKWDATLSVPYTDCASPRYFALGLAPDDTWKWTHVDAGTRRLADVLLGQSPLSCMDDDQALQKELRDSNVTCATHVQACDAQIGMTLCSKSCGFCGPWSYESVARYPKAMVTLTPVIIYQTRLETIDCEGFAGIYQKIESNAELWHLPPLDGKRNSNLLHCLDRLRHLDADYAMEKDCPSSAPEGKCTGGKLRVTPKAAYQGMTVYPVLLSSPKHDLPQLEKLQWLDVQTESVTVSTVVYTGEVEVFSLVTVTFTFTLGGNIKTSFEISSYRDVIGQSKARFITCMVLAAFGAFVGVIWNVRHLVKEWHVCSRGMVLYQLVSRGLHMAFLVNLLVSWGQRESMSELYQQLLRSLMKTPGSSSAGEEALVLDAMSRIEDATSWMKLQTNLAYLVSYFQFVQMIFYMSAHPKMAVLTETIHGAASHLIHFFLSTGVLFLMLGFMAHWMLGAHLEEFSSFGIAIRTQIQMLLGEFIYIKGATLLAQDVNIMYWIYAVTFVVIACFTSLNFLLAIIVDAFCAVKADLGKQPIMCSFFVDIWLVAYIKIKWRVNKWPARVKFLEYFKGAVDEHKKSSWIDLLDPDVQEDREGSSDKVCVATEAVLMGVEGLTDEQLAAILAYYYSLSPCVLCRLLVFHASDIRKHVPDVAKFLRVVGVEEFVLRDQSLPCRLSHPGSGCAANALRLSVIFWWRLFPSLVTTRVLWSIARGQRGRIDVFALLRFSAFLFFTCSVPGYIFCLTKRGGRAGSEAGVALSAFAGAMALNVLPLEQRSALINRYCLALTLLWLF